MAKKAAKTVVPNLFAKAKTAAATAPKKEKGTIIQLPKELGANGQLTGESAILNAAVTQAIEASSEEKAAKNKGNLAKGRISTYAQSRVVDMIARIGVLPPTPINIVNHNGESVTYVMSDKSQQYPISDEQIDLLNDILGEDAASNIVDTRTIYSFDPETMDQKAANCDQTVFEIVCEVISNALATDPRLSDDQKSAIIKSSEKTYLRAHTIDRMSELCGADVERIGRFMDAVGSACVRYVKC